MKITRFVLLNLKRRPIQNFVIITSLTLTLLFGLILSKFVLISHERFSTMAREGQALITSKSSEVDSILLALNLEGEKDSYIPFNLYQTLLNQTPKSFEDGQKVYARINQIIPFLNFGHLEKVFQVLGTNSDFLNRFNPSDSISLKEGRWFLSDDEIVLGQTLAKKLDLSINQTIDVQINKSILTKKFKIVGILNGKNLAWDKGAYTSITSAQKALEEAGLLSHSIWKSSVLSHALVYLSPDQYPALQSLINERTVSQVFSIPEAIIKLENISLSGSYITSILVIMISVLGMCSILGAIISRAGSTINSLAILHSLGYEKVDLYKIVLFENMILWIISSLLSSLFYCLLFFWIQNNITFFSSKEITCWSFEFNYIFSTFGIGIILLSAIPLLIIYKKGIHNILRAQ